MDITELESQTEKMIARMLRESTGMSTSDGAGIGERFWEMNENRDFTKEPTATLSFKGNLISVKHSTYHWMNEHLEYDRTLNNLFYRKYKREVDPEDDAPYLKLMEKFPKWLASRRNLKVYGLCGEGDPVTINTYAEGGYLSQGVQFVYFEIDNRHLALVQVHNGSDPRGGYTEPKAFEVTDGGIFNYSSAKIECKNNPLHNWNADGSDSWYYQDSSEEEGKTLHTYERKVIKHNSELELNKLCIDEIRDEGFCPICSGKLIVR
jgi:hypothetical protein